MKKYITPIKSIRKFCVECSGGSPLEVKKCVIHDCHLYPYRMGKNPNRKIKNQPREKEKTHS